MTDRPSSPEILRAWRADVLPLEEPEVVDERRAQMVSLIAREIRESAKERTRAQRNWRVLGVVAAAAAVVLILGGLFVPWHKSASGSSGQVVAAVRASGSGVVVLRAGQSLVAGENADQALAPGDSVSTVADARASLRLASGTEIAIEPSTRVTLAEASANERVALDVGEVSVRVPPLGPNRSFVVSTPDARVIVHGTAFTVHVDKLADGTTQTSVSVTRGKVGVEHGGNEIFLTVGQSWSSAKSETARAEPEPAVTGPRPAEPEPAVTGPVSAEPAAAKTVTPAPPTPPPAKTASATPAAPVNGGDKVASTDPSALAAQNKLFSAAAAARQRGDDRAALGYLAQLLSRYPDSPLAPEARVERFRALKRLGNTAEAAREARRYLAEQNDGPARDEARQVALDGSK